MCSYEIKLIYIGHDTVIYNYKCDRSKPKGQVINWSPRETLRKIQYQILLKCDKDSHTSAPALTEL